MLLKKDHHLYSVTADPLQNGPHATLIHSLTCPGVTLSGAGDRTNAHPRWCSTWVLNSWSSRAQPAWESMSPLIHPSLTPCLATDAVSLWHKEFPRLREAGVSRDPSLHWITAICKCQVDFSPPQIKKRGWRLWEETQRCQRSEGCFPCLKVCVKFSWDSQSSASLHVPTALLMKGDELNFQPLQFAPFPSHDSSSPAESLLFYGLISFLDFFFPSDSVVLCVCDNSLVY